MSIPILPTVSSVSHQYAPLFSNPSNPSTHIPPPISPSPAQPTPHPQHIRPLHLMITWIRGRLIQNPLRRAPQLHPLPLKPQIPQPRHVLLPVPEIILKEQTQALCLAKQRPLDGDILYLGGLGEVQLLRGRELRGEVEVDVVAVDEELEGAGGGGGLRGAD